VADTPPDISARRRSEPNPYPPEVRQDQQVHAASDPGAFDLSKTIVCPSDDVDHDLHPQLPDARAVVWKASRLNREVSMLALNWAADSTSKF
jgi:hypothetical protein